MKIPKKNILHKIAKDLIFARMERAEIEAQVSEINVYHADKANACNVYLNGKLNEVNARINRLQRILSAMYMVAIPENNAGILYLELLQGRLI